MSDVTPEKLYNLLPAVYRLRDADHGYPLRALMAVIESQVDDLQDDITRLYDNWFIETCDEWLVPYIGDLLGVRGLLPVQNGLFSQRGLVANAIDYRRRKGTAAMLEQLARDLTGWEAKAVEFFELLDTTQSVNHVRLDSLGTANLRDTDALAKVNSPFECTTHTADVRHIDNGRGQYNIPNLGLFLWRLQSYTIQRGAARPVADPPDGRYWFSPLGLDMPLFNSPQTASTGSIGQVNVPQPLLRRALFDELQARRQAMVDGVSVREIYFGVNPVLQVWVRKNTGAPFVALLPEELVICDLEDWRRPSADSFTRADGTHFSIQAAVDPGLGRLTFPTGVIPAFVQVSYAYGFSGDLGGGPYARRAGLATALTRPVTFQVGVMQDAEGGQPNLVKTLSEAVNAWNSQLPGTVGVIAVMDNGSYAENLAGADTIQIPAGSQLAIVAADWPLEPVAGSLVSQRVPGQLVADERRPHLRGSITVQGTSAAAPNPGELVISGLLVEGALTVQAGNLGSLRIQDSTLVPGLGGLAVGAGPTLVQKNSTLRVSLDKSIVDTIVLAESVRVLDLKDCVVGSGSGAAISGVGVDATMDGCTILGLSSFRSLNASNSIFTQALTVIRRQAGCVRFSYLPVNSLAPRRYHCQPSDPALAARIAPQFTTTTFGAPGYAQLATSGPTEIATGADDEGELGAFHFLQQVQRVKNLQASLGEYLRFGLEAGIFFAT